jgi:hypothetical protein
VTVFNVAMKPADEFAAEELVKKRIVFKTDAAHAGCWHTRVGITSGIVLRLVPSITQKAELLAAEGIAPPEVTSPEMLVPRLWVQADPCPKFPRGCEMAVEKECLLLPD